MSYWPTKPLSKIASVLAGDPAPQGAEDFTTNGYPFVRMQDVGRCGQTNNLTETADRVSQSAALKLRRFPKGSILVPKSGASIRLNHRAILGIDAYVVSHLAIIIPNTSINARFLYYWLCSIDLSKVAHETDFPSLRLTDLKMIEIPCPPIPEQERIVRFLDEADQLRQLRKETNRRTQDLIPALFHHMFNENIASLEKWPTGTLKGFGVTVRYGLGQPPEEDPDGVPLVRATNIKRGAIVPDGLIRVRRDRIPTGRNAFLKAGEVLVVRSGVYTGDIGHVAVEWDGSVAGYDLVLTPFDMVNSLFLTYLLLSPAIQDKYFAYEKSRAAQSHLNAAQVENTPCILPPLLRQRKFASYVIQVHELNVQQAKSMRKLDELFQSLLRRAFQGEL